MKHKGILGKAVTFLIVAVLAVMAFIRGPAQEKYLLGAFVLWGLGLVIAFLLSNKGAIKTRMDRNRLQKQRDADKQQNRHGSLAVPIMDEDTGLVLLKHVNFRISTYLKSVYPEVTWEWCVENPERIVAKGGTGRIRLFGVPDFNYADVLFDQYARIDCEMLKIVPLVDLGGSGAAEPVKAAPKQPSDPQVWYDIQGKTLLESLVSDLNSRGYSSLTIRENGDVCIMQADAEVPQQTIKNLPDKGCWKGLAKLLEKEGLAASVADGGILVSW